MEPASETAANLRKQIQETEIKLAELKAQLLEAEARIEISNKADKEDQAATASAHQDDENGTTQEKKWPLSPDEYKRYGRQLITPSIGIQGVYYRPVTCYRITGFNILIQVNSDSSPPPFS